MHKKETDRFRAADRYGNHLTVVEHSFFAAKKDDAEVTSREYRLADGRRVTRTPTGTFEVVGPGTRLWRV